jgi:vitamin B12 transporter
MSLLAVILLLLSFEIKAESISLDQIDVVAEKEVSDFSFSRSKKIPVHKLEAETIGNLSQVLDDEPSLIQNQNGGPGSRVSFFLRGTESRHVAFTLDGMKINDPSNTDRQFDAAFFTLPFLKEVTIHKGPQAVLYGSDAIGGVVELKSRKGESAPETRFGIRGGSFATTETYLSSDWKIAGHQGTFTANRFLTEGISRLNKKRYNAKEKDASDISQLSSSSSHIWNGRISTELLVSYLRGENELDGATDDNDHDKSTNDHYVLQQKTEFRLTEKNAISIRNGLNRHQRYINTLSRGVETFDGNIVQNEILHKFQEENFQLLSGLATEHEDFNTTKTDVRSFDLHSLFVQGAFTSGKFKFQTGARGETHTRYGDFYTGSAGVAYDLEQSIFSLQYSQGFKAPSLYQLHGPFGNNELMPEVNHSWEASWTTYYEQGQVEATLFQNRLSNLITYSFANAQYLNQGRFVAEGIELSSKRRFDMFELQGGYTYQQFRKEEEAVLRRPQNSLLAGVAYYPTEASEISFKGRWFSARKDFNQSATVTKLNGFETFDLGARYYFATRDLDAGIQLINLLDREYEELFGYSVMPRSLFAHLGITF